MPQPEQSLNAQFESKRLEDEKNLLFQADRDFEFLTALSVEQSRRIGGIINFVPVSTERKPRGDFQTAGVDTLDGDVLTPQFIGTPPDGQNMISLHCIIQHEPEKQLLKKYGIDEQRDIVFFIPFREFEEKGLISDWRPFGADIGDLIFWDGSWYQAWEAKRDSYFGQRDRVHFMACFCDRYRHNSVPTEDVAPANPFGDETA
jgi:hypothetical protein